MSVLPRTQIRLNMVTGSFLSSGNHWSSAINDQTGSLATGSITHGSLNVVLSHMASAIKRVHGADSFSEASAGVFHQSILPNSAGGIDLGSSSAELGDVYLADDKKIKFGSDQDVTIEYDTGAQNALLIEGGDIVLVDDKKLYFGTGKDASFEYDEDGTDTLLYDGASIRITDDTKLEFGTGGDSSIEYDEDGNDVLLVAGADWRFGDDIKLGFGAAGDATIEYDEDGDDVLQIAGAHVRIGHGTTTQLQFGDDATYMHQSADGDITIRADANVKINNAGNAQLTVSSAGALIRTDQKLSFRDTDTYINSSADGTLALSADNIMSFDAQGTDAEDGFAFSLGTDNGNGMFQVKNNSGTTQFKVDGAGAMTVTGDATITGNLTVNGTTATVNVTNLYTEDPVILMGDGAQSLNQNGGIVIASGSAQAATPDLCMGRVANDTWGAGMIASASGSLTTLASMTLAGFRASKIEIDGANDYIDVDTDLKLIAAADIVLDPGGSEVKVDGNLVPNADDGGALGATGLNWSDLYLADSAVLNFGDDQDVKLTHTDGSGIHLNSTSKIGFGGNFNAYIQHDGTDLKLADDADINLVPAIDLLVDAGQRIILDADTQGEAGNFGNAPTGVVFKDGGTAFGHIFKDSGNNLVLSSSVEAKVVIVSGSDGQGVSLAAVGGEGQHGGLALWSDQGDDNADKWAVKADNSSNGLEVGQWTGSAYDTYFQVLTAGTGFNFGKDGADQDIAMNFKANTSDGLFTWMEDEDYFQYSDDILMASTEKIHFQDTGTNIHSPADGEIKLVGDGASAQAVWLQASNADGDIKLQAEGGEVTFQGDGPNPAMVWHHASNTVQYFNFTTNAGSGAPTEGSGGFGLRNNAGTMQMKNNGGSWANITSGGGVTKKTYAVTGSHDAATHLIVAGLSHDLGVDPDKSDLFLNGQLLLSGSDATNGDYKLQSSATHIQFFFNLEKDDVVQALVRS